MIRKSILYPDHESAILKGGIIPLTLLGVLRGGFTYRLVESIEENSKKAIGFIAMECGTKAIILARHSEDPSHEDAPWYASEADVKLVGFRNHLQLTSARSHGLSFWHPRYHLWILPKISEVDLASLKKEGWRSFLTT